MDSDAANMLRKLAKAGINGTLAPKVRARVKSAFPFHAITDGNVRASFDEVATMRMIRRRYSDVLDAGSPELGSASIGVERDRIWMCWLQGIESAPAIVRACANSCLMANPEYELTFLTQADLPGYVQLPGYIMDKRAKGIIPAAHFSDLIRMELLYWHGGAWADSTVLFTDVIPEYVWSSPLFVFKELDLSRRGERATICSSWFIRARRGDRILGLARELLFEYWKDSRYLDNYFLFHIALALAAQRYPDDWGNVPTFNNHSPHVMGFELDSQYSEERWGQLVAMSPIHKLNRYDDFSADGSSFYSYILERYGI